MTEHDRLLVSFETDNKLYLKARTYKTLSTFISSRKSVDHIFVISEIPPYGK